MPRHSPALGLVLLAFVAGCGGGKITAQSPAARAADYSPSERIRVMLAPPGSAGEAASRAVSARIIEVLQQTHADVALVPTTNDAEALAATRAAQATYLVSPTIVEWIDGHAPPFSADRVKIRLALREPNVGEEVSAVTFENVSSMLAVTDTQPQALLDESFNRAVTVLITTGSPGPGSFRQPGPKALEQIPVDQQKYPRQ